MKVRVTFPPLDGRLHLHSAGLRPFFRVKYHKRYPPDCRVCMSRGNNVLVCIFLVLKGD